MDKPKMTTLNLLIIIAAAITIVSLCFFIKARVSSTKPTKESCWYEIKYLHVSGREITKRVYMTCEGFRSWHWSERYNIPAFLITFADGNEVVIQGSTDILSVEKTKTMSNNNNTPPPWSEAPPWAMWRAQDKDGYWCFYKHEPCISRTLNAWSSKDVLFDDTNFLVSIKGRSNKEWWNTLQKRPENE